MNNKSIEKFVRCNVTPNAPIRHWFAGSIIYFRCSCGTGLSYDSSDRETHLTKFEVPIKRIRRESPEQYYNRALAQVKADPEKYIVSDWTE